MVATQSTMLKLGTPAPPFTLTDVTTNQPATLQQLKGQTGTLIIFTCNHCPYAKHIDAQLAQLGHDYSDNQINLIAISSNDAENYPNDAPEKLAQQAQRENYTFPYLHDPDQNIALAYTASCTPDFYLFDAHLKLTYRGQLDDSRPNSDTPVTGTDIRAAIHALQTNQPPLQNQKPSIGCSIKWKPQNTPSYFPS